MDKPKILIVDDEWNVIKAILRLLMDEGYELDYTTSALEGFRKINEKNYDIVISDQRMSGYTGLNLLIHCKNVSPNTIRILMTGYEDLEVIISAVNDGSIFHYFSKPWRNHIFTEVIRKAVQSKQEEDYRREILESVLEKKEDWLTAIEYEYGSESSECKQGKGKREIANFLARIIQIRDDELYEHGVRVSVYAVQIAEQIGLSENQIEDLRVAGLLHDIGKIAIKDRIVYKPDFLDYNEYEEMKKHSQMGADILNQLDFMKKIALITEQHHEKIDGSGYPKGLTGDQMLIEAKILAICDAYDALTDNRVYRKSLSAQEAINIIAEEGKQQYDPNLVQKLIELVAKREVNSK